MKLILRRYFVLTALIFFSANTFASDPPPPPKNVPPGNPIDSNIFILILFALALGLYKLYQLKKYKKTPN